MLYIQPIFISIFNLMYISELYSDFYKTIGTFIYKFHCKYS
jgi:hypothetical protein